MHSGNGERHQNRSNARRSETENGMITARVRKNSKGHAATVTRPPHNPIAPEMGLFHDFGQSDGVTVCTLENLTFSAQRQRGRGFAGFFLKTIKINQRVTTWPPI